MKEIGGTWTSYRGGDWRAVAALHHEPLEEHCEQRQQNTNQQRVLHPLAQTEVLDEPAAG